MKKTLIIALCSAALLTACGKKVEPEVTSFQTVEEQRAAAMKAAAKRVASFREQHMGRVHDIVEGRWDQALTPQQIARASDELIARGEKPSMRRVAEILGVSQIRVEKGWPQGVPLDGTGEYRAA